MILIGQRIGAGNKELARKVGFEVELYCAVFMLCMGIFFFLSPQIIGRLYTKDPEVLSYLIPMIRFGAFFQIFDGGQIVFSFCLRGAGDTTYLFLVNLLGSWVVFIPATLFIVYIIGKGVIWTWACMYGLMFLFFLAYGIRYLTLKWDRIKAK
jgi:Na+-driven multidrug efflux pump